MAVDMNARYRIDGFPGVAFYLRGYSQIWEPFTVLCVDEETGEEWHGNTDDGEWVTDPDFVRAVMVGDDREHIVDVADLHIISDDDYCGACGQLGCTHDGR